jgi:hypothetical protein
LVKPFERPLRIRHRWVAAKKLFWACLLLLIAESNHFFILAVGRKDFN